MVSRNSAIASAGDETVSLVLPNGPADVAARDAEIVQLVIGHLGELPLSAPVAQVAGDRPAALVGDLEKIRPGRGARARQAAAAPAQGQLDHRFLRGARPDAGIMAAGWIGGSQCGGAACELPAVRRG
jgi:hypothetical protein